MKNRLKLEKIILGIKEKISSFLLENKKILVACSGGRDSVFWYTYCMRFLLVLSYLCLSFL